MSALDKSTLFLKYFRFLLLRRVLFFFAFIATPGPSSDWGGRKSFPHSEKQTGSALGGADGCIVGVDVDQTRSLQLLVGLQRDYKLLQGYSMK